ncbi:UDP-N-acetylglucosamine 1-carboxyvinyltransferase [Seinonella peptonophila]|uniref:UDP-N-acetylglucosamine 1-carboxyvinyltransferase n=1 Tax=Seinonella peptonophila TaxID=112248 RepID=A0A1M4SR04_9BACL|nr:UDP-N-acetylglucosamine 1-carboxyvinyltransferase [Seinonella peptonophila]SHE34621.1 UDP-N-acetylglucosamine 1-carboxyvinyltransferase [Seinonella peptonophila]
MNVIAVTGGTKLDGVVQIPGAKNGVLPLIAAATLATTGVTRLTNIPYLSDVIDLVNLLKSLNMQVALNNDEILISTERIGKTKTVSEHAGKIRGSLFLIGPLLARKKHVYIPYPGGCKIGERPIDYHIEGLEKMGATFISTSPYIKGYVNGRLKGATVNARQSVGTTLNLIMAAVLAEGKTVIHNAAKDPEIEDVIQFLTNMGAQIHYAEENIIEIEGVTELTAVEHRVPPDRMVAGTYLIAAAATRGSILVKGANEHHLKALLDIFKEIGVPLKNEANGIRVLAHDQPLTSVNLVTGAYPEFPTDLQPLITTLCLTTDGISKIEEKTFLKRFTHVPELQKMGADITIDGSTIYIQGGKPLYGTKVRAYDMRAGAALTLAGLIAKNKTKISNAGFIDRGYPHFVQTLRELNADIGYYYTQTPPVINASRIIGELIQRSESTKYRYFER